MRNQTDLMRSILTNETAQRIIDFVAPVYGNSYVALWIYQSIGSIIGETYTIADQLKKETNPISSTLLIDMWEDHYMLERAPDLTIERRRERIANRNRMKGYCNPSKLTSIVSGALGGVKIEFNENTSKNKFQIIVLEEVESLVPAITMIDRVKPAHLIYDIFVEIRTGQKANIKAAVAMTYSERYTIKTESST